MRTASGKMLVPTPLSSAHYPGPAQDVTTGCGGGTLHMTLGDGSSGAGGELSVLVAIRNAGPGVCSLKGYPSLRLLDDRHNLLPFRISHLGNQTVTRARPVRVNIEPNSVAYFQFSAYRCDERTLAWVAGVDFTLPGLRHRVALSLDHLSGIVGYCGAGNPGSIMAVSPVEPSRVDTER